mgnify:CR=1 FL=1
MRSARLSPEESSAIAVVYTVFLAYVVFRDAKLRDFGKVIKNALKTLAIVMTLLATAKAFAYMMTELRIPAMITEVLLSVTSNKYVLMLIIVTLCWVGAEYVIEGVVHTSKVDGYVAGILSCQLTFELFRLDKELGREKDA